MNKIKKEFESIKLSLNKKEDIYKRIIDNKKRQVNYKPLLNALAVIILVLILIPTITYATSLIFGFDINFLKINNYTEKELTQKGVRGEIVDYSDTLPDFNEIRITNIIFDKTELNIFITLNWYESYEYMIFKNDKNITYSSSSYLQNGTSYQLRFNLTETIENSDKIDLVIDDYRITLNLHETITKNKVINVKNATINKNGKKVPITKITITPMGALMEVETNGFNESDYVYDSYDLFHSIFVGTNDSLEYVTSTYESIEKKDNTGIIKYNGYNIQNADIIDPDEVKYVHIYNYIIDVNGESTYVGNNNYQLVNSFEEIKDNGRFIYVEINDYFDYIDKLSYDYNIKTYVKKSKNNIIKKYDNNNCVYETKLINSNKKAQWGIKKLNNKEIILVGNNGENRTIEGTLDLVFGDEVSYNLYGYTDEEINKMYHNNDNIDYDIELKDKNGNTPFDTYNSMYYDNNYVVILANKVIDNREQLNVFIYDINGKLLLDKLPNDMYVNFSSKTVIINDKGILIKGKVSMLGNSLEINHNMYNICKKNDNISSDLLISADYFYEYKNGSIDFDNPIISNQVTVSNYIQNNCK